MSELERLRAIVAGMPELDVYDGPCSARYDGVREKVEIRIGGLRTFFMPPDDALKLALLIRRAGLDGLAAQAPAPARPAARARMERPGGRASFWTTPHGAAIAAYAVVALALIWAFPA